MSRLKVKREEEASPKTVLVEPREVESAVTIISPRKSLGGGGGVGGCMEVVVDEEDFPTRGEVGEDGSRLL